MTTNTVIVVVPRITTIVAAVETTIKCVTSIEGKLLNTICHVKYMVVVLCRICNMQIFGGVCGVPSER